MVDAALGCGSATRRIPVIDYTRLAEQAIQDEPPGFDEAVTLLDGCDVELLPLVHAVHPPWAWPRPGQAAEIRLRCT